MQTRHRETGLRGDTHVCGAIACVVPDVIHHGGKVLQTVWDVVRKQQYTHRLQSHTHTLAFYNLGLLLNT